MFSKNNIPKLIIISPIIAIVLITLLTSYFFVSTQYSSFEKESLKIEKDFIKDKRNLLKKEVNSLYSYLEHQESIYSNNANEEVIKNTYILISRLELLYEDLNKDQTILKSFINSKISDTSYFFAYDIKNQQIIQPENKDIKQEFYKDEKFFENYLFSENGKLIPFHNSSKIVYVKYLPKLNWIVGNIKDISKDISFIKNVSKEYISSLKFDNTAYTWLYDNVNKNMKVQDKEILASIENIIDSQDGFFINYKDNEKEINKLAFTKYFEKWEWVVGASLNLDDIQNSIQGKKAELTNSLEKYIYFFIYISLGVMITITILSFILSTKISNTFKEYQKKDKEQKRELKKVNINLSKKVRETVNEIQYKERAMLYQSRLAMLGTMLSMIAHQWRQPLSEVSGILMELETATKFKKVDEKLILNCTKDADRLLCYMSDTIDDFRTFFRPSKEKIDFLIIDACNDSISLMASSFKECNIKINKNFENNEKFHGYKREFSQVILSILMNAKDIFIQREIKNAIIDFTVNKKDEKIFISISDNAGGIFLENIDIIFEPYFSTKKSNKATGMGLYMSKMIIENNMDGKLEVSNIIDEKTTGTKFNIIL